METTARRVTNDNGTGIPGGAISTCVCQARIEEHPPGLRISNSVDFDMIRDFPGEGFDYLDTEKELLERFDALMGKGHGLLAERMDDDVSRIDFACQFLRVRWTAPTQLINCLVILLVNPDRIGLVLLS